MTETQLLSRLLIRASELGLRLFRNNTGMLRDANGRPVRYGLCVGSSDLIGWTPVTVTPAMVGTTVAVFTAMEAKVARNTTTEAQGHFLDVVREAGGVALIARQVSDIDSAVQRFATSCDGAMTR